MIRDPSDGSVQEKITVVDDPSELRPSGFTALLRAMHGENWGLKSLDKPARQPRRAPTAEELREHYARHNLGFQTKAEGSKT